MPVSTIDERRAIYDRTADRSREVLTLAAANVAVASVIVAGGLYMLDASAVTSAGAFGEIRIEMQRGGGSWVPMTSVTGPDRPSEMRLPAQAVVRAVLTGTTGAVVTLSRVPA